MSYLKNDYFLYYNRLHYCFNFKGREMMFSTFKSVDFAVKISEETFLKFKYVINVDIVLN